MTERRAHPKSTCCISGCPRWSRRFPGEWLCGRHWKMVPRRCRRALSKIWRLGGKAALHDRLWAHALRIVTLREAGL